MALDWDAFHHDFEDISVPAEVGRSILDIVDCIYADKGVILSASVVVDIVFLGETVMGVDGHGMCLCFFIIISIAKHLDVFAVGGDVLPLFFEVFEYLPRLGLCPSHFKTKFNLIQPAN